MPVVAVVAGVAIKLYFRDHEPAHFHAEAPDGQEMLVRISDLAVIAGRLPPAQRRAVLEWAEAHKGELALAWLRCRQNQLPGRIG